jgi:hypothetical protein
MNVLDALLGDDFHDHVGNIVAIAQMMMKGNGHAVPEARLFHGFLNGGQQLGLAGFQLVARPDRAAGDGGSGSGVDTGVGAFKWSYLTIALNIVGDVAAEDVFHVFIPSSSLTVCCPRRRQDFMRRAWPGGQRHPDNGTLGPPGGGLIRQKFH